MNKQEIKEFISKHLFEEMEFSDSEDFENSFIFRLFGIDAEDEDHVYYLTEIHGSYGRVPYCRPPQPKQMRNLTIEELWGRTLVHPDGSASIFGSIKGNLLRGSDGKGYNIEDLIDFGWKVNDKPSLDGAQDLRVEVSGE